MSAEHGDGGEGGETGEQRAPWFAAARIAWVGLAVVMLAFYALGLYQTLASPITLCINTECPEREAVAVLSEIGVSPTFFRGYTVLLRDVLVPLGYVSMSLLLFRYERGRWLALSIATLLLLYPLAVNTDVLSVGADVAQLAPIVTLLQHLANLLFGFSLLFVLSTFPNGRFVPAWLRWFLLPLFFLGAVAPSLGLLPEEVGFLATLALLVPGQLYRYFRRSLRIERQQSKWGLLGLLGLCANAVLWLSIVEPALESGAAALPRYMLYLPFGTLLVMMLPVGLAIAILRYRLYNIDIIIRRTLLYTVLSGTLALFFFGSVVLLQRLLAPLFGQESQLAVVASTLAIAALFNPLRARIQRFIDRRFYRQKYDAQQTLAAFAASLRQGEMAGLEQITDNLLHVIEETVQPEQVGVWLREK